jgi:nicotinamide phosphoribosyltransferase
MGFNPNILYYTDAYKIGHKAMLAPKTTRLYGTEIPRSLKYGPKGSTKITNFGKQIVWKFINDHFQESFFNLDKEEALLFGKDMSLVLGQEYNAKHFEELYDLGYLPIKVCALPEGVEVNPNIPTSDFINTVDDFGWLTLYLETIASCLSWKPMLTATIARQYRRICTEWVMKTDPQNAWLIDYMCHDFSARGLNPHDLISVGLGHATAFRGSDTLLTIPASRYYYNESSTEVVINSVNASEHSVSTTKIFTVGEQQMIADWLQEFPTGILSIVADTFDLWKLITEYLPANKEAIMSRNGKLVIRPDSGDPVNIICGENESYRVIDKKQTWKQWHLPIGQKFMFLEEPNKFYTANKEGYSDYKLLPKNKGVIELLWDIFGGTTNEQGYKVLDPHIGAIYGDSINLDRQLEIYKRLEAKGFATTNIVLGIGSFTYGMNSRDSIGLAYKGAWFEVEENKIALDGHTIIGKEKIGYNIYKDPVTDDGTKKSLKGFQFVYKDDNGQIQVESEVTEEKHDSKENMLQPIFIDGLFYNQTSLTQIRKYIKNN